MKNPPAIDLDEGMLTALPQVDTTKKKRKIRKAGPLDHLNTPQWILDVVYAFGPVKLDPCSNEHSLVKAKAVHLGGPGDDGLAADWDGPKGAEHYEPFACVFVNCPYSDPLPWIEKAAACHPTTNIITLTFLDPSVEWGRLMNRTASARCEISQRVKHYDRGKPSEHTSPKASALHYFGPHSYRFMSRCVDSKLGPVIHLRKHMVHDLGGFDVR